MLFFFIPPLALLWLKVEVGVDLVLSEYPFPVVSTQQLPLGPLECVDLLLTRPIGLDCWDDYSSHRDLWLGLIPYGSSPYSVNLLSILPFLAEPFAVRPNSVQLIAFKTG